MPFLFSETPFVVGEMNCPKSGHIQPRDPPSVIVRGGGGPLEHRHDLSCVGRGMDDKRRQRLPCCARRKRRATPPRGGIHSVVHSRHPSAQAKVRFPGRIRGVRDRKFRVARIALRGFQPFCPEHRDGPRSGASITEPRLSSESASAMFTEE